MDTNDKFEINWEAKEILAKAKSKTVDILIAEVRKPLGETNYNTFFSALEAYCMLRNARKALWRF